MPIKYTHVTIDGVDVPLTPREHDVIVALERDASEDRPYDAVDLETKVFGGLNSQRPGKIAHSTIQRVRRRLKEAGVRRYRIVNRPGEGYYTVNTE